MAQARVFVTYVPNRVLARPAGRASTVALAPATAALAGALLAGGAAHSVPGPRTTQPSMVAEVAKDSAPPAEKTPVATREDLPILALTALGTKLPAPPPRTKAVPASAAPAVESAPAAMLVTPVMKATPTAPPRLDLEGFLADQGLDLAPAPLVSPLVPPPQIAEAPELDTRLDTGLDTGKVVTLAASVPTVGASDAALPIVENQSFPMVSVAGQDLGAVTVRGDTVHLGGLLGLLQLKLPAEEFARLRTAPAAESFVGIDTLREAGLSVTLDNSGERLTLAAL